MLDVHAELSKAVQYYWRTRAEQAKRQGTHKGVKDTGNRSAVTGGKHADGFIRLMAAIVRESGLPEATIRHQSKQVKVLPGYYRPSKEWDLLVLADRDLVAVVEVKSQVGSFGNNFNNRVEEALGNATDFWAAYAKGIYAPSARPWLGYLFMLEESESSLRPTRQVDLSPFPMDQAFQRLSYAQRYEEVCRRLVRERLYDAACFITSNATDGLHGLYTEPSPELGIRNFAFSLAAKVAAYARLR